MSAVIFGLESLIRPFQWQLSLIPVLPTMLLEMLDAPVAFLAGITNEQLRETKRLLTIEEQNNKIWVDCTTGQVEWP